MDISKLVIEPHLKNGWSAVDLGFTLARRWYWQLLAAWAFLNLPLFVLLLLLLPVDYLWISSIVIWWFKPFWERGPLWVASRFLFQDSVDAREFIRLTPQLYRRRWFPWLTYARFHPSRSFLMPVTVLEALKGQAYADRARVLEGYESNKSFWLTIVGIHVESAISLGIFMLLYLLIPEEAGLDYWQTLEQHAVAIEYLWSVIAYLTMALVAPFYATAGFMLYINRRIQLEGWDIEIRFRLLAERLNAVSNHSTAPASGAKSVVVAALISAFLVFSPTDTLQAEVAGDGPISTAQEAKERIQSVAGPEPEKEWKKRYRLRLDPPKEIEEEGETWWQRLGKKIAEWFKTEEGEGVGHWLAQLFNPNNLFTLAGFLKLLVTVILLGAVAWAIVQAHRWYVNHFQRRGAANISAPEKPVKLFGLDVTQDSLPDDVANAVRNKINDGEYRQALALLYRSTLSQLMHKHHFHFADGDTESECAAQVKASRDESHQTLVPFVDALTTTWQALAYAHHALDEDQAVELVDAYQELFDEY